MNYLYQITTEKLRSTGLKLTRKHYFCISKKSMSTGKPALRRYSTYFLFAFSTEALSGPKFTFFDLFGPAGIFFNALVGLSGVFGFSVAAVSSVQQT